MKKCRLFFEVILLFSLPVLSLGQGIFHELTISIDLAVQDTGIEHRALSEEGSINVVITNILPGDKYIVETKLTTKDLSPLEFSAVQSPKALGIPSPCDKLISEFNDTLGQLMKENNEKGVPKRLGELDNILKMSKCASVDSLESLKHRLAEVKLHTIYEVEGPLLVRKGQALSVEIRRRVENGRDRVWTVIFDGGERGKWLVTYGFSFPLMLFKDEDFFSKAISSDTFKVTRSDNNKFTMLIPSVFFHWFPSGDELENFSWGLTAGLNFDISNPAVFFGGSMLYNQNIGLSLGFVLHQVKLLNGRYHEGDIIKENLSSDQLLSNFIRLNPFIAVNYRLGSNPFGGK